MTPMVMTATKAAKKINCTQAFHLCDASCVAGSRI
jgi:hypothetical protein